MMLLALLDTLTWLLLLLHLLLLQLLAHLQMMLLALLDTLTWLLLLLHHARLLLHPRIQLDLRPPRWQPLVRLHPGPRRRQPDV